MPITYQPLKLPKRVNRKMRMLRWLVRLYVGLEGLAAVALVLGLAFWVGLALDWTFEPSRGWRILVSLGVMLATSYVALRYLFSRAAARLPNTSLALLLERNYPELQESLVTTVEAAQRRRTAPIGNKALLNQTSQHASDAMRGIQLRRIFHYRPLVWKSVGALGLLVSVGAFALLQSDAFGFWLERLSLSSAPWPRRVELSVSGFEMHEGELVANVARADDFELRAFASIVDGHSAPEQVEIRYTLADSRRGRHPMTEVGEALPGRDTAQEFQFRFKSLAEDLWFDIVGDDDRILALRLRVVERPQIFRTTIDCQYPSYMQRPARSIPFRGRVELPEGAQVVCRVEANKTLRRVVVHEPAGERDLAAVLGTPTNKEFSFSLDIGADDRVLLLTLHDQDGVENREPYRVVVSAVADQPPEVSVQVRGIGSAVTPQARIPFVGRIADQYGIEDVWIEYQVDQDQPQRRGAGAPPAGRLVVDHIDALDLAQAESTSGGPALALQPGQQLSLAVQARDAYDLGDNPHVGSSQRFLLDIVTDSELRALLEKRELALRQRFEAIYEKMQSIQELLGRIEIRKNRSDPNEASPAPTREASDLQPENTEAGESEQLRLIERDRLRIGGSLISVTQLAYETIGVSEGFDDIVVELVNNRVETEDLKQRLVEGIAEPLREIGADLMPTLEQRIQDLQSAFPQDSLRERAHHLTIAQGEVVLLAMKEVLERMLELESYNELVELLRAIVSDQQQLQEQTKGERRSKLRSLLDEE